MESVINWIDRLTGEIRGVQNHACTYTPASWTFGFALETDCERFGRWG